MGLRIAAVVSGAIALFGCSSSSDSAGSPSGGSGGTPATDAGVEVGKSDAAADALADDLPYPSVPFPKENPFTDAKAVLGKILFWDEQLSADGNVACGTCHRPSAGGSDPRSILPVSVHPGSDDQFGTSDDVHGSMGIASCDVLGGPKQDETFGLEPQVTSRRSPSTLDAMFAPKLFWDGRAGGQFIDPVDQDIVIPFGGALETQAAAPFLNNVEMACEGQTWFDLEAKIALINPLGVSDPTSFPDDVKKALEANATYQALFQAAFPNDGEITTKNVVLALATYERMLTSNQTPWDRFIAGDASALTASEQRGLELFNGKARCNSCHRAPLFTDDAFHVAGLTDPELDDGLGAITLKPNDKGKLKTPSLRNVGLREGTGLLHNGTAASLDQIVEWFDQGGAFKQQLDPLVQPLGLSQSERTDLVAFLRNGLTDPRVANETAPFDRPQLRSEQ